MEPLDLELKNVLSCTQPIPPAEVAALNRRIVDNFARKQRGISLLTGVSLAGFTIMMLVMIALYQSISDLKICLLLAVGILMAVEGTVVIKLWYWTMHSKIATLREIKLLQLAVADLKASLPGSSQSAGARGRKRLHAGIGSIVSGSPTAQVVANRDDPGVAIGGGGRDLLRSVTLATRAGRRGCLL